jgi:nucleoside triphosphate diphosphatase
VGGGEAKSTPKSLLGGLAPTLPALLRAFHISTRAASVGFDWVAAGDVVEKMQEELDEIRAVVKEGAIDHERAEEEMGDLLFTIANLSRKLGIEPETALRKANDKFTKRFGTLEQSVAASGRAMKDMTLGQLEAEWQRAKR